MFSESVVLPVWQLALALVLAVLFLLDRLLIPSVRWMIRRKVNRVITEINEHLQIGIRPFQLTKRKVLIDRLVFDPLVIETMDEYAREKNMPREVAQEEVRRYAREIVPAFNAYVYFRLIYRLCRFVCRQLYRVRVGVVDEDEIREIDRNATVVFVMNHRSNIDYMLVAYLASRQTTLSYAAGEWAKVFLLQSLIRAMGAFFVRRDSGNPLYRRVLERYVHMASREGVCQAVFPEGGLTKTGAIAPPKLGFLDYMLRGYDVDKDRDIVFIPIGINYDHVLEDTVQIRAGQGKRIRRSTWHWVRAVVKFIAVHFSLSKDTRRDRFGYASVNFGHVVSAKQFARSRAINFATLDKAQRFEQTAELASLLMNGVGFVTPILPVPLIAQVFQRAGKPALSELQIIAAVHRLIDDLIAAGAPLSPADIPAKTTVVKALTLLQHYGMVDSADGMWRTVPQASDRLAYYGASISHWFDEVGYIDPQQHRID
ncbi:MAG: 1-acyl-sn-glycerol-3-phosphate acyltransferase [Gammaproteobacteria bacterium]|jgi:glycerol-3-phosphate O-acyltransferase